MLDERNVVALPGWAVLERIGGRPQRCDVLRPASHLQTADTAAVALQPSNWRWGG